MIFLTLAYRTAIMFIFILITMRVLGKRQMGELQLNELIVAFMLSELAVSPITNLDHRLLYAIIPIIVLLAGEMLVAFFCMKSVRIRSIVIGKPSIIVQNGEINQVEMRKNRLTLTELCESLRAQGQTDISNIKYAILEVNGTLSILPYTAQLPATHTAHGLTVEENGLPVMLICDGRILDHNLNKLGLDQRWLEKELKNRSAKDPKQVFLLSIDENQNIYYAPKEAP